MKVNMREERGVTILDLQGKITIDAGYAALRHAVTEAANEGRTKLVVNLARVTTMDSTGLGELVNGNALLTNRGGRLALVNLPASIAEILAVTQLMTVFDVFDDETEAVDSFQ